MALEKLHLTLVVGGGLAGRECPQVSALAGFGVHLSGIEPVLAGFEFSNHV